MEAAKIIVIGAGIGGLTTAALLTQAGYAVTVLEAQTYPGGCAGTFFHQGYRFEAGATVAGGFQPNGPHDLVAQKLNLEWKVRRHEPAWVVHLPNHEIALTHDNTSVLDNFPASARFWEQQSKIADLGWRMSAQGLPWPPTDAIELSRLARTALRHFPHDLRLLNYAFASVGTWLKRHKLDQDPAFVRFIDAQLLISAQTTSPQVNAVYGATALDLARQGTYHVETGIGGLAQTLVEKIQALGGQVLYRQQVTRFAFENGRIVGVYARKGTRTTQEALYPADFVVANLTPWSLDRLLGEHSPKKLQREVGQRRLGWGAFVLHLGVDASELPKDFPDHHQIIGSLEKPLGEGNSLFLSFSPDWDTTRAPAGHRALTITTHTDVQSWWDLLARDSQAYHDQKATYTEQILDLVETHLPNFRRRVKLALPGSPITYQFYTGRHLGMVGGFPQTSLFKARGPRVGISNLRLVGDSIFPGQSTAGVSVGAMRVAQLVQRYCPNISTTHVFTSTSSETTSA